MVNALVHLFPAVPFDKTKFRFLPSMMINTDFVARQCSCLVLDSFWKDLRNRKQFFDEFSVSKRFNPLIPEEWYSVTANDVKKFEVFAL